MPDRLPSLILLVGFWVPPAIAGRIAADMVRRRAAPIRPAQLYSAFAAFVVAWAGAWFLFQLNRIPPYLPGATMDPTFAPPEAVARLALIAAVLVLPVSALACWLGYRSRVRGHGHPANAEARS